MHYACSKMKVSYHGDWIIPTFCREVKEISNTKLFKNSCNITFTLYNKFHSLNYQRKCHSEILNGDRFWNQLASNIKECGRSGINSFGFNSPETWRPETHSASDLFLGAPRKGQTQKGRAEKNTWSCFNKSGLFLDSCLYFHR